MIDEVCSDFSVLRTVPLLEAASFLCGKEEK